MKNYTALHLALLNELSEAPFHRVFIVSIAINFCVVLHLVMKSFGLVFSTCKKTSKKTGAESLQKLKNLATVLTDEAVNIMLATTAVVCVALFPVQTYRDGSLPPLLEILVCCNSGRYFFRVGLYVSWDSWHSEKTSFHKFLHHMVALIFYISILVTNENWWIGVIGNFIEMDSFVTTTHFVLKQKYTAYEKIEKSSLIIQVISALCVRLIIPVALCVIFLPNLGNLENTASTVSLYVATVFFIIYNIYICYSRIMKSHRKRVKKDSVPVQKVLPHPVHCIEINDIFSGAHACEKSKPLMIQAQDSSVLPDKQLTWSMVGLEDISIQKQTECFQHRESQTAASHKKSVRFVDNPSYFGPQEIRMKPTLNINTDTTGCSEAVSKGYSKCLIFKPSSP